MFHRMVDLERHKMSTIVYIPESYSHNKYTLRHVLRHEQQYATGLYLVCLAIFIALSGINGSLSVGLAIGAFNAFTLGGLIFFAILACIFGLLTLAFIIFACFFGSECYYELRTEFANTRSIDVIHHYDERLTMLLKSFPGGAIPARIYNELFKDTDLSRQFDETIIEYLELTQRIVSQPRAVRNSLQVSARFKETAVKTARKLIMLDDDFHAPQAKQAFLDEIENDEKQAAQTQARKYAKAQAAMITKQKIDLVLEDTAYFVE